MEDFVSAAQVVQHASRIKAPGVGAEVVKGARAFLEKQIEAHVKSNPGDRVVLIVDD